jgi:hypothetical protein
VVEGLHPLVDPLASMLPGPLEPLPIQCAGVGAEHLAAQPFDRLDLDPPDAAEPAGGLHRPHITLERLGPGQCLQVLDVALGRFGLEGLQQRPGG